MGPTTGFAQDHEHAALIVMVGSVFFMVSVVAILGVNNVSRLVGGIRVPASDGR